MPELCGPDERDWIDDTDAVESLFTGVAAVAVCSVCRLSVLLSDDAAAGVASLGRGGSTGLGGATAAGAEEADSGVCFSFCCDEPF